MNESTGVSREQDGIIIPEFTEAGAFRRTLDSGVRLHMDRPLPFLVLNRHPEAGFSLAHRIAAISASGIVWCEGEAADRTAVAAVRDVLDQQCKSFEHFLLLSLYDLPADTTLDDESPRLEDFRFTLSASADEPTQAAARCLASALAAICLEQRQPAIDHVDHAFEEPGMEKLLSSRDGISRLSLGLPQIYRVPGEDRIYPEIFHALETTVFDALLKSFSAFIGASTDKAPAHHRSLGRSSFIEAALTVDRELARISRSFDFLLSISPINTGQAFDRFSEGKCEWDPVFRYRPLTVSPETTKRALYALDFRAVEDPVLETLFREKQQEIDQQLLMLQARNTRSFRYASQLQYGGVDADLLALAHEVLATIEPCQSSPGDCRIDCHAVKAGAEKLLERYRRDVPDFHADVVLRDDIAGLMVSGTRLMISTSTRMSRARLDPLLQHEVSVHLLTCINGSRQGLGLFGAGLAGYEGIQEGLGVFAEYAVDGLTGARLRLLGARVLIVDAMLHDADFIECHRLLHLEHGFSSHGAFNIVARVFRSGGLSKDAIYLRGLKHVFDFIAAGNDLDPFWYGKIAEHHVPVVAELKARGMLREPALVPEFLQRPSAISRIEKIRSGASFIDLIRS